jgi:NADPH:quinone reductase-like Zn-dependent oxidoreductase
MPGGRRSVTAVAVSLPALRRGRCETLMRSSESEGAMARTESSLVGGAIPAKFHGIGYTKSRDGFPLEEVHVPVPRPAADQILIRVLSSSLNPLDYKLAELNFLGRTPPVILGFDLAGIVVAAGEAVKDLAVGDAVTAMADSNGDGGWAVGGTGGYALAREFLAVKKPPSLTFRDAAVLPICFIAAFKGLYGSVRAGDTVYIPGGAGGVGHLAVQMAARALGAARVISSASTPESMALARVCGAHHVFDYRHDDIGAEIAILTDHKGVDVVFDSTYNEASFADTAKTVRQGGTWVVLGVGPGKTSRQVETESPVDAILAGRGARHVNANMLRYFSEPATLDAEAKSLLRLGLNRAMEWAVQGVVVPHIGKVIDSAVNEINAELENMKMGKGPVGKVAVIVDRSVPR